MNTLKRLLFPVSITSARLQLETRWWHRAVVVLFFVLFLPLFVGAALLGLVIAKGEAQAIYFTCVERDPLLSKQGVRAVVSSPADARVRAYDSFFSSKNNEELERILRDISLPNQVRADLWNAKYAATHPPPASVSSDELSKYDYVLAAGRSVIEFPSSMSNKEVQMEIAKRFPSAKEGRMPVHVPEGFTVAKLKDGITLYLHTANLSAAEVKRRVEIFRASPAPQTLPAHFFDKKAANDDDLGFVPSSPAMPKRSAADAEIDAILGKDTSRKSLRSGYIPDKAPYVTWDVESPEEVTNPFQPAGDSFDIADAQVQRDHARETHEWESCRDLSPSRHQGMYIFIAILGVIAGSYLLQGLYRALLYIAFG